MILETVCLLGVEGRGVVISGTAKEIVSGGLLKLTSGE